MAYNIVSYDSNPNASEGVLYSEMVRSESNDAIVVDGQLETIEGYLFGETELDLSLLFDLPNDQVSGSVDTSNIGDYVSYDSASGNLYVDASGSGNPEANGDLVAIVDQDPSLNFSPAPNITILVDDGADQAAVIL